MGKCTVARVHSGQRHVTVTISCNVNGAYAQVYYEGGIAFAAYKQTIEIKVSPNGCFAIQGEDVLPKPKLSNVDERWWYKIMAITNTVGIYQVRETDGTIQYG